MIRLGSQFVNISLNNESDYIGVACDIVLLEEARILDDVRRKDFRRVVPKRSALHQHAVHELGAHHLGSVPLDDSRVYRRRQKEARDVDRDASARSQVAHRTELPDDRHQHIRIDLAPDHSHSEMRISIVPRISLEQRLERHFPNPLSTKRITGVRVTRMEFLSALDDEQGIAASNDNSGMPEFVRRKEKRSYEIQLEGVEQPGACRLVKEDYVARFQIGANITEQYRTMLLVSKATPLEPARPSLRVARRHEII